MQLERRDLPTAVPESPRVVLLALGPGLELGSLEQRLRADAADVEVSSTTTLPGSPPSSRSIVLACLPRDAPEPTLRGLVAWCRRATEPVGLVGYAPHGNAGDSERALAAGFDDFVAGRDSPREVSARVRAVARRLASASSRPLERLHFGQVTLDLARHELVVGDRSAAVTPLELSMMKAFIEAGGRPLTREDLLTRVWGSENIEIEPRAVDNLIWRLRRKLGGARLFAVVRGVGFRLLQD
jgi:DNA-binding response OmpR family regulator